MAVAPGAVGSVDAAALNQELALEVLRQAQETVKAQLAAGDSLTTKLTTVFGQAISLALAALGAAALALNSNSWLPIWAAVGLVCAGLAWGATARTALIGLRPQDWTPPAFEPEDLWIREVLNPLNAATGYLYIAAAMQTGIKTNHQQNVVLARTLVSAQRWLISALWVGVITAAGAAVVPPAIAWITSRLH